MFQSLFPLTFCITNNKNGHYPSSTRLWEHDWTTQSRSSPDMTTGMLISSKPELAALCMTFQMFHPTIQTTSFDTTI